MWRSLGTASPQESHEEQKMRKIETGPVPTKDSIPAPSLANRKTGSGPAAGWGRGSMAQAGGGYLHMAWLGSIDLHQASSQPKLIDALADGDSLHNRDFAIPSSKGSTLTSCLRGYPCRRSCQCLYPAWGNFILKDRNGPTVVKTGMVLFCQSLAECPCHLHSSPPSLCRNCVP